MGHNLTNSLKQKIAAVEIKILRKIVGVKVIGVIEVSEKTEQQKLRSF